MALDKHRDEAVHDSTHYANFLKDRYHAEAVRDTLLRQVNLIRSMDEDRYIWPHVMDESEPRAAAVHLAHGRQLRGHAAGQRQHRRRESRQGHVEAKKKSSTPKRMATDVPSDAITIRVSGRTVDIQAITRFMKDLEASPYFFNVQLDKSEAALEQGKEVMQVPAHDRRTPGRTRRCCIAFRSAFR